MTTPAPELTQAEIDFVTNVIAAYADAIRELKQVPSGHLYANLAGILPVHDHQLVINFLVNAKLIKVENHLITWIGK